MRIWITRLSAGSLHAGGLERCRVWFTKPEYHFRVTDFERWDDSPFDSDPKKGYGRFGWYPKDNRGEPNSLSFGKAFGYADEENSELAEYVWNKLIEHFNNTKFPLGWSEEEDAKRANEEDFLLEIDISIIFNEKF